MSNGIKLTVTNAGIRVAFAAQDADLQIKRSHIAFGSALYSPDGTETSLRQEFVRLPITSAKKYDDHISLGVVYQNVAETRNVSEIGAFLEDGTLFAVFAWPDAARFQVSNVAQFLFQMVLALKGLPADHITVSAELSLELLFTEHFLSILANQSRLATENIHQDTAIQALLEHQAHLLSGLALNTTQHMLKG